MWVFSNDLEPIERVHKFVRFAIRASLFVAAVGAIESMRWIVLFLAALTFALTFLPKLLRRGYRVQLPVEFELIILVFIYATLYLGEVHGYYTRFWWWDALLHTGSGVVLGFIGFLFLYVLYQHEKVRSSPILIAFFTFCFALAIGAVWEIFEFVMDQLFATNMQKSGLVDTMWDLIVDSLGALAAAIAGFFYVKYGKAHFFDRLFERFIEENPRLFRK